MTGSSLATQMQSNKRLVLQMGNYKHLISCISVFLRENNLKKAGNNFVIKHEDNFGILNFQKSRDSSAQRTSFTVNFGVYLNSLAIFNNFDILNKPMFDGCHWKQRLNPPTSGTNSAWWEITSTTSVEKLCKELIVSLQHNAIIPIRTFIVDENLINLWLSGAGPGLSEQQRLLYLTTVLKSNNDDRWQLILQELEAYSKGKMFEANIKEALKKINI